MADSFTANLNLRKPEVGFAEDTWGGVAGLNGDLDILDALFAADGSGTSVGLHVGTGKAADMTGGTVVVTDTRFHFVDDADPTKNGRIGTVNIATGTSQVYQFPPVTDTLVGLTQAQVITNKTTPDPPVADNTQALVPAHWVNAAINAAVTAALAAYAPFNTGDIMASANAKPGWLQLIGQTIGNAGSAAVYANAAALNLFTLFWDINSNAWAINGGRGASAAADFAALKTITLPDARGYALIMAGGAINLGSYFATAGAKETAFTLTEAQMPAHTHGGLPTQASQGVQGAILDTAMAPYDQHTEATGGGAAVTVPIVQPSMAIVWWIKL